MGTPITTTIDITQDRKVTMPIPARIESPEDGNTRLATPCFFEGLPDYANVDSRAIELIADDNTPFAWFWVDLRDGPLVIEVPPKVLWLMNDMWYRWVADVGITGPGAANGGKYLLLPSDYEGEVPGGCNVVRLRTLSNVVIWRGFRVDNDPRPEAKVVKEFTKIYRLASAQ